MMKAREIIFKRALPVVAVLAILTVSIKGVVVHASGINTVRTVEVELVEGEFLTEEQLKYSGITLETNTSEELDSDLKASITLSGAVYWDTPLKSSSSYYFTSSDSITVSSATWTPQANKLRFGVINKTTGQGYWGSYHSGGSLYNYKLNLTSIPNGDYYVAVVGEYNNNPDKITITANITL